MTICTEYNPETCIDDFGWIWDTESPMGPEWALVFTVESDLHDPIDIVFLDDRYPPQEADPWRGRPYLSCPAPTAEPGKCDALDVTIRIENGATIGHAFGDGNPDLIASIRAALLKALETGRNNSSPQPKDQTHE